MKRYFKGDAYNYYELCKNKHFYEEDNYFYYKSSVRNKL